MDLPMDYTLYYAPDPGGPHRLTCGRLAQAIERMFPPAPRDTEARPGAEDPAAVLGDGALWARAAGLQWRLRSDGEISPLEAAGRLAALHGGGAPEAAALRRLAAALPAAGLPRGDPNLLLQIAALGRDFALGAAAEPALLDYVKTELQPVDLATLLD